MKKYFVLFLAISAVFVFYAAWNQHPYRGGVARFEHEFGVKLPDSFEIVPLSLKEGSFWDNPRFRFRLKESQFEQLTKILREAGYSEWKDMGGSYGSFNEESHPDNPLLMSYKHKDRWKFMFFYRPSTGILDAVTFFN